MSIESKVGEHRVIKAVVCAMLATLAWVALILSAPMINRTNVVALWGDGEAAKRAILLSGAHVEGRKGALLLVRRRAPDLASDLVDLDAGVVLPAVFYEAF